MTVKTVTQRTTRALQDKRITAKEAKEIIKAAETNTQGKTDKVSKGEAKKIAALFEGTRSDPPPGVGWNPPPPGTPMKPSMEREARKAFNDFFIKHRLPMGENEGAMTNRIKTMMEVIDRGEPLAKAPSTRNLHEVFLHDHRPVDGERLDAFVDSDKNRFYVRSESHNRANPSGETKWYGPFAFAERSVNPPRPR